MPRSEHHRLAVLEDAPMPPGFHMPPDLPMLKAAHSETAFGVGGVGGSFAYADAATGIAFGLTKNRIAQDFNTATEIIRLINA